MDRNDPKASPRERSPRVPWRWFSGVAPYAVALLTVVAALLAQLALEPIVGGTSPFLLFTPAVTLAAWYGGLGPGVLATLLSAGLGGRLLASSGPVASDTVERVLLFLLVGVLITWLNVRAKREGEAARASAARERAARTAAETADQAKQELLAIVAHEMRSPANVLVGWASTLRNGSDPAAVLPKALPAMERNARLLARLIDDIIDTFRGQRGTLRVERREVDLLPIVTAAVHATRDRAALRGVTVQFDSPTGAFWVLADEMRLDQVFTNLLSNALKFTPEGGRIEVDLSARGGEARVRVADTGRGIDSSFLPRVFEPFERARGERSHGLGLGLAVSRNLVVLHGGRIEATSEGLGRGTTVTVSLPLVDREQLSDSHRGQLDASISNRVPSPSRRASGRYPIASPQPGSVHLLGAPPCSGQGGIS